MARQASGSRLAVHIGADVLTTPRHLNWSPMYACRDAVERMSRLCAGMVAEQRRLLGPAATVDRVRRALAQAVEEVGARGLLVLTFVGHSEDAERAGAGGGRGWCLYDGTLPLAEVAEILAAAPATASLVVVADTCYAAALAAFPVPATTVLIAACGAEQLTLARPTVGFIARLERLVRPDGVPNPDCTTYSWLDAQLRMDSPDVERSQVWTNRATAWADKPFARPGRESPVAVYWPKQ